MKREARADVLYHFNAMQWFSKDAARGTLSLVNLDGADVQYYNDVSDSKLKRFLLKTLAFAFPNASITGFCIFYVSFNSLRLRYSSVGLLPSSSNSSVTFALTK